jgi:hypothetical protein
MIEHVVQIIDYLKFDYVVKYVIIEGEVFQHLELVFVAYLMIILPIITHGKKLWKIYAKKFNLASIYY